MVLSNPAGFGMGSTGMASRVNTGSQYRVWKLLLGTAVI